MRYTLKIDHDLAKSWRLKRRDNHAGKAKFRSGGAYCS